MSTAFEPLPLVIGVTGHRDLREVDVPQLEAAISQVIARVRADYLKGSDAPIIVLSALAEGADQLVARVALRHDVQVIAPIPMPIEEYRRDFENGIRPDALEEFDGWCKRGIPMPVVPFAPGSSLAAVQTDPDKRNQQYRALSKLIARHCDILIALWDGDDDGSVGGTAELVRFKRCGIPLSQSETARMSLDAPEIGPVVHIETPRANAAPGNDRTSVSIRSWGTELVSEHRKHRREIAHRAAASENERQRKHAELALLDRDLKLWRWFAGRFELTRVFDREAEALLASRGGKHRVAKSLDALFAEHGKPSDSAAKAKGLEVAPRWCHLYAVADTLAKKWQSWFRRDWAILFLLGFIVVLSFEVFAHLVPTVRHFWTVEDRSLGAVILATYIGAFVCTFFWFLLARLRQHQARYLDYRALAEALRVSVYWRLNGVHPIADSYPAKFPRELAWVKSCLLTAELFDFADQRPAGKLCPTSYGWSRNLWIGGGQAVYFRDTSARRRAVADGLDRLSLVLLFGAFVMAVGLWASVVSGKLGREDWQHELCLFAVGVLPAMAAVFVGYAEQMALKAQSRQFARMQELYERALQLLPPTLEEGCGRVDELFRAIGTEAMRENAEWVAIYRQRPIRLPHG